MPRVSALYAERKRRNIEEAALAVISELGYAGATVDDVAARAGCSKGALYGYYPSKQALLLGALDAWLRALRAARGPGAQAQSPVRQLRTLLLALEPEGGRPSPAVELWAEATRVPALRQRLAQVYERYVEAVAALCTAAEAAGELAPGIEARALARLLVAATDGALVQHAMGRGGGVAELVDPLLGATLPVPRVARA